MRAVTEGCTGTKAEKHEVCSGASKNESLPFRQTKKHPKRGAFHKAGFTYRNLVGRWLAAAENKRYMQRKRREINPRPTTKGVRTIVRTPFHTPCSARYSVLHLFVVLSGGDEPPLCKGRWLAQARRRDCKSKNFIVKQALRHLRCQLPLHKGAFGL